jgi:ankyrin repeat protein
VRWLHNEKKAKFADADDINAAFFGALGKGDYLMARLLVKYGANVRTLGWRSQTALHVAARQGNIRLVVWLAQKENLALDAQDELGQTPLDLASNAKIREYFRRLIAQKEAQEGSER